MAERCAAAGQLCLLLHLELALLPLLLGLTLVDYAVAPIWIPSPAGRPPHGAWPWCSAWRPTSARSLLQVRGVLRGLVEQPARPAGARHAAAGPADAAAARASRSTRCRSRLHHRRVLRSACRPAARCSLRAVRAFFPQLTAGPIARGRASCCRNSTAPRAARPEPSRAGRRPSCSATSSRASSPRLIGAVSWSTRCSPRRELSVRGALGRRCSATPSRCSATSRATACSPSAARASSASSCPENFDYPFLSSLLEFWRRWHITLNTWLFDYIYTPLVTGTGVLRGRVDAGLLLVFLLSGLWHGARADLRGVGALHGLGLMVNRAWDEFYRGCAARTGSGWRFAAGHDTRSLPGR